VDPVIKHSWGSPMKGKSICGYKRDFHGFLFAMLAMLDFGT
jgi:hypothetical protein